MTSKYQAPTVKKAFDILRFISREDRGVSLSDLSRKLGISKGTVHGIASALEGVGAVVRDQETKRFRLGVTLFELGRAADQGIALKDAARPVMEELMERTRESVFLGVRNGSRVTVLDIVESMQDLKITAPVGSRIPLLAGATGKAFLAAVEGPQAEGLVRQMGLVSYTDKSMIDPVRYLAEVDAVRKNGYATDYEEYISGVRAVASAVRLPGGEISAIWVVGFTPSMTEEKMKSVAEKTRAAAESIRRRMEMGAGISDSPN